MSGTLQSLLISALEYLNLIHPGNGVPTENLTKLVHSEGGDRQRILKEIVTSSYSFIFHDDFNLSRATAHQLQEKFTGIGTSGDTTRKCIGFFMHIAKEAGIPMSPHLKKPRGRRPGAAPKTKKHTIKTPPPAQQQGNGSYIEETEKGHADVGWQKLLLSKFPSFDPAWPDDVKTKWFDGFKGLMDQFKQQENADEED